MHDDLEKELSFRSSRSSGSGGQNVNKVSTKIELSFDVVNSSLLTEQEKFRVLAKLKNRIGKDDVLKITSHAERSQYMNKQKAIEKFKHLLQNSLKVEKKRIKTKTPFAIKEERLILKKKTSLKKSLRKKDNFLDD